MAASDEHPKHGEVLDEVLRDEIKDAERPEGTGSGSRHE